MGSFTSAYLPTGNLLKLISLALRKSIGRVHCWNSSLEKTTIRATFGYFEYLAREAVYGWFPYLITKPGSPPKKGVDPFIY